MSAPESLQDGICQIREATAKQDAAYVANFMIELITRLKQHNIDISEDAAKELTIAAMSIGAWTDAEED